MTNDTAAPIGALETYPDLRRASSTPKSVERMISYFETRVGPMVGARVVARAWVDLGVSRTAARQRDAGDRRVLGIGGIESEHLVAVENTPRVHNVVGVHAVLVLPVGGARVLSVWYKLPQYRSSVVPVLRARSSPKMGLTLPPEVEMKVGTERRPPLPGRAPAAARYRGARRGNARQAGCDARRDDWRRRGGYSPRAPRGDEMTAKLDREGPASPPRRNGELAFAAPWERQLFGVTMALHERGGIPPGATSART